jgi:hypothetical protein
MHLQRWLCEFSSMLLFNSAVPNGSLRVTVWFYKVKLRSLANILVDLQIEMVVWILDRRYNNLPWTHCNRIQTRDQRCDLQSQMKSLWKILVDIQRSRGCGNLSGCFNVPEPECKLEQHDELQSQTKPNIHVDLQRRLCELSQILPNSSHPLYELQNCSQMKWDNHMDTQRWDHLFKSGGLEKGTPSLFALSFFGPIMQTLHSWVCKWPNGYHVIFERFLYEFSLS